MREEQPKVESGANSAQSSVSQRARDGGFMRAANATVTDWVLAGGRRSGILTEDDARARTEAAVGLSHADATGQSEMCAVAYRSRRLRDTASEGAARSHRIPHHAAR